MDDIIAYNGKYKEAPSALGLIEENMNIYIHIYNVTLCTRKSEFLEVDIGTFT